MPRRRPAGSRLPAGARPPCRFAPGDTLLLFSDGVVERRRQDLAAGLDALADAVATAGSGDPRALCAVATAAVAGSHRGRRRGAGGGARGQAEPVGEHGGAGGADRAEPGAALDDRASCTEWRVPESVIGAAVLCTSELTTNALLHAGTAARVEIDLSPERLLVSVADSRHPGHGDPGADRHVEQPGPRAGPDRGAERRLGHRPDGPRLDGLVRDPHPAG